MNNNSWALYIFTNDLDYMFENILREYQDAMLNGKSVSNFPWQQFLHTWYIVYLSLV